ncbi:hypothetical protein Tco_0656804 [Tanacetum coccineum]|uniref:Uncharacterized protein n=1 Tax=Tanacetum coccineum TaxID=301880 RepID=A0ABQ4XAX5_9ASTR
MILILKTSHHGPSDAMHNPPSYSGFSQKKFVSFLMEINTLLLTFSLRDRRYYPGKVFWGADEEISDEGAAITSVEEQLLPPVDSPTAESPGYVAESDPKEDPKKYEDDETEDGLVDYPMDGGDDGDDDDGNSSGDDADDEDEDEEEEEHPNPADSTVVVPTVEHVSLPEGTEPVIPPPSIDISTTRARITVRLQASIPLPPEVEVERLLAMTTPSPSPPISLLPPSAGERLARCTAPPIHSSPPPVPSPLLPSSGCPTQIQTLRIASTQALIDVVTAALPSPLLPPLPPSLYIPPPVDHRDNVPESELPPRKRLCLSTLGSRYEIGESSTARPTGGRGVDYGFVSTADAKARWQGISEVGYGIRDTWVDMAEAVPEIAPMTVGEVNTRVTELHERDTQDLYVLLKDAQDGRTRISQRVAMDSQQMQQAEMVALRESDRRRQAQMVETLRVMRDMRQEMSDMQAKLLAHREQQGRARQPVPDARILYHQDASGDVERISKKKTKNKAKTTNRTRNGKDCERQSQIKAGKSIKSKSQQKSQLVKVKVNPSQPRGQSQRNISSGTKIVNP